MQFSLPDFDTVLEIHKIVVEQFGGLAGVPHPEYVQSAITRPQNYMTYTHNCDIHLVAAIILNSIATYHAFSDGNKRTALIATLMTYRMNNVQLEYTLMTNNELEALVLKVAGNKKLLTIRQLRTELKTIVEKYTD